MIIMQMISYYFATIFWETGLLEYCGSKRVKTGVLFVYKR